MLEHRLRNGLLGPKLDTPRNLGASRVEHLLPQGGSLPRLFLSWLAAISWAGLALWELLAAGTPSWREPPVSAIVLATSLSNEEARMSTCDYAIILSLVSTRSTAVFKSPVPFVMVPDAHSRRWSLFERSECDLAGGRSELLAVQGCLCHRERLNKGHGWFLKGAGGRRDCNVLRPARPPLGKHAGWMTPRRQCVASRLCQPSLV